MTHWARPGVKCVCIKPKPANAYPGSIYPEINKVYTIRAVKPKGYGGLTQTALMLNEVDNSHIKPEPYEPGFVISGFRPLITRTQEQDMELFTPLLDVHNHKELEREFQ